MGLARPDASNVEPVESLFAYPMGRWKGGAPTTRLSPGEAANIRKWLRVALASEMQRPAQAAVASAVDHLTQRKQFGRPLGAFPGACAIGWPSAPSSPAACAGLR
jgi:hypothetical protein